MSYWGSRNSVFRQQLSDGKFAATLAICGVTILGNSLTIAAMIKYMMYHSYTNILILSLAVSDWMLGFSNLLRESLSRGGVRNSEWSSFANFLENYIAWTSAFHLFSISVERYIAIIQPLRYYFFLSKGRFITLVVLTWVIPVFISGPDLIIRFAVPNGGSRYRQLADLWTYYQIPLYFTVGFLMSIAYFRILKTVFRQARLIKGQEKSDDGVKWKREIKATQMLSIVILAYYIAWTPNFVRIAYSNLNSGR